jgi:hypothetical protein
VETAAPLLPLPPPPPPPDEPAEDVPVERDVPLTEVFALDEMLLPVLVLDSTVELALAVEEGDSAEFELLFDIPSAVPVLAEASADVEAADEIALPEDGVNNALPGEADAPAPAPDDDPAVFDTAVEEELLFKAD